MRKPWQLLVLAGPGETHRSQRQKLSLRVAVTLGLTAVLVLSGCSADTAYPPTSSSASSTAAATTTPEVEVAAEDNTPVAEVQSRSQVTLLSPLDVRLPGRLVNSEEDASENGLTSWVAAVELAPNQASEFIPQVANQLLGVGYSVDVSATELTGILRDTTSTEPANAQAAPVRGWVQVALVSGGSPSGYQYATVAVTTRR